MPLGALCFKKRFCASRKNGTGKWEGLGIALFPGSPLAPPKNRKGGGEPGTDILRHDDVTAIITKVVTQLCSHVIG